MRKTHPLLITGEIIVTQTSIDAHNVIGRALCQDGVTTGLGVLNVLLHESDTEHFTALVGASASDGRYTAMEQGVELLKDGRLGDARFSLVAAHVEVLLQVFDSRSTYTLVSVSQL